MRWTPDRDALLRQLIEVDHISYRQAAKKMGITRHSAIGRGYRLKLKGMAIPEPKPAKRIPEPPKSSERVCHPITRTRTYQDWLEVWPGKGGCKYPLGDPGHGEFRFCCEPRKAFSSYCSAHHGITRIPVRPRQEKRL